MSSTYDRFRQAASLMEAAEKAGLPAPSSVGVDNYSAPSIQTPVGNADAFAAWVRFASAEVEAYPEPYSGSSNIYANGEVDGLKVRIYAGAEITEKVRAILDQVAAEAPIDTGIAKALVSDETLAEVARQSADYTARGGNDGIIPETPKRGDRVMSWWPAGCDAPSRHVGGPYCSEHVNYHHVASGSSAVLEVWPMTPDEIDQARKAAAEAAR